VRLLTKLGWVAEALTNDVIPMILLNQSGWVTHVLNDNNDVIPMQLLQPPAKPQKLESVTQALTHDKDFKISFQNLKGCTTRGSHVAVHPRVPFSSTPHHRAKGKTRSGWVTEALTDNNDVDAEGQQLPPPGVREALHGLLACAIRSQKRYGSRTADGRVLYHAAGRTLQAPVCSQQRDKSLYGTHVWIMIYPQYQG
jgi:hypothetical protein